MKRSIAHFLTGEELSQLDLIDVIAQGEIFARQRGSTDAPKPLTGKSVALVFEKPSLRTRLSFSVGVNELGGQALDMVTGNQKQEEPEDMIRVLQGMVHMVMWRTFSHSLFARVLPFATIPVINGLSDLHHPCQAIADLLTLKQRFNSLKGLTLSYIGDGNNVLHSLLLLAPYIGVNVHYSCPKQHQPDAEILARAQRRAKLGRAKVTAFTTPELAVKDAHAVYTDVWTSMGFESENAERVKAFQGYQLNLPLFEKARSNAIAMHCLPMVRGQEITSEVADHRRSALFQQAENRLHAQKALMDYLACRAALTTRGELSNAI